MIAKKGIDKAYGARPLRRTIQNEVEDRLAEEILDGNLKVGEKAKLWLIFLKPHIYLAKVCHKLRTCHLIDQTMV